MKNMLILLACVAAAIVVACSNNDVNTSPPAPAPATQAVQPRAQEDAQQPFQEPWVKFEGVKYTMVDLTGVPFETAKGCVESDQEPAQVIRFTRNPGSQPWPKDHKITAPEYYQNQASGAVAVFLAARMLEKFEKTYDVPRGQFMDIDHFDQAVLLHAKIREKIYSANFNYARSGISPEDYASAYLAQFPNCGFSWQFLVQSFEYSRHNDAFSVIDRNCFPMLTPAGTTPKWVYDSYLVSWPRPGQELTWLIDRNKDKVIEAVDWQFSNVPYTVLSHATDSDLKLIEPLLASMIDENGNPIRSAIIKAHDILAKQQGSKIGVMISTFSRSGLAAEYGLSVNDMAAGKFISIHGEEGENYLYIIPSKIAHCFKDYLTTGGSFAFDVGEDMFVVQVARAVLRCTEVSPGIVLPSAEELAWRLRCGEDW